MGDLGDLFFNGRHCIINTNDFNSLNGWVCSRGKQRKETLLLRCTLLLERNVHCFRGEMYTASGGRCTLLQERNVHCCWRGMYTDAGERCTPLLERDIHCCWREIYTAAGERCTLLLREMYTAPRERCTLSQFWPGPKMRSHKQGRIQSLENRVLNWIQA